MIRRFHYLYRLARNTGDGRFVSLLWAFQQARLPF